MFNIAVIEITNRCNALCRYCYENNQSIEKKDLDINQFTLFIEKKISKDCVLSGGEPFLHPYWPDFVKVLRDHANHVHFISNGSKIHQIIEHQIRLDSLTVSLDSFSSEWSWLRSETPIYTKTDVICLVKSRLVKEIYLQLILSKVNVDKNNIFDILSFCDKYELGLKIKVMDSYCFNQTQNYCLSLDEILAAKLLIKQRMRHMGYSFPIDMPPDGNNDFCSCAILQGLPNLRVRSDGAVFACEKADDAILMLGDIAQSRVAYSTALAGVRLKLKARMINLAKTLCNACVHNQSCNKGCPVIVNLETNEKCVKGRGQHA